MGFLCRSFTVFLEYGWTVYSFHDRCDVRWRSNKQVLALGAFEYWDMNQPKAVTSVRRRVVVTKKKDISKDECMAAAVGDCTWLEQSLGRSRGAAVNFNSNVSCSRWSARRTTLCARVLIRVHTTTITHLVGAKYYRENREVSMHPVRVPLRAISRPVPGAQNINWIKGLLDLGRIRLHRKQPQICGWCASNRTDLVKQTANFYCKQWRLKFDGSVSFRWVQTQPEICGAIEYAPGYFFF